LYRIPGDCEEFHGLYPPRLLLSIEHRTPDDPPANSAGHIDAVYIQRTIRYILSIAVTALFLTYTSGFLQLPLLDSLENQAYDARMKLMPSGSDIRHVVIVTIDEPSLAAIGRWPWPRDLIAAMVDQLFDYYRIKALGFDIVFAEPDRAPDRTNGAFKTAGPEPGSPSHRDRLFAESLDTRRTVLGYVFGSGTRKGELPGPVAVLDPATAGLIPFIRTNSYTANLAVLQAHAYGGGFFDNPLVDDDGVFRRAPLLQQYDNRLYESLPLALARSAVDSPDLELVVATSTDDQPDLLEWLKIGNLAIPVDEHASVFIPYLGARQRFSYIPAVDVLNGKAGVAELEGKIVLLGTTAPGLLDLHTTPVATAFPGVEIHANVIQGILDQSIIHRPGYMRGMEFLAILLLGMLLTVLFTKLPPAGTLVSAAAIALLLVALNLALWSRLQVAAFIATPLVLVVAMYLLHISYGLFMETRKKHRLARLLGQYIPAGLVDETSAKIKAAHLDGEVREMSVLFSDIHNFTAISEGMDPKELTRLVNAVFNPIGEEILRSGGTIDKYMGDAAMAFWGAPVDDPDHARHAVEAAMKIVERVRSLNPSFQANGWPAISIGIGINSGAMNVGNKGSDLRVDYTVIGDAVNLGSRLETLSRIYGVDIVVGENTRNAIADIEFRELDRVRVKGKQRPVVIYEPLGKQELIDDTVRTSLERFDRVLEYYRERRWDDAGELLDTLISDDPQCRLYALYRERIAHFRRHPPPDDWDGTFTHTSK
jgi:adenylate cyclase